MFKMQRFLFVSVLGCSTLIYSFLSAKTENKLNNEPVYSLPWNKMSVCVITLHCFVTLEIEEYSNYIVA